MVRFKINDNEYVHDRIFHEVQFILGYKSNLSLFIDYMENEKFRLAVYTDQLAQYRDAEISQFQADCMVSGK